MPYDFSSHQGVGAFVEEHGVVLESSRGPVPSLAEAIAGEVIRGNWWTHPKGRAIFRATRLIRDSPDVLVCRLVGGKITYIHRRLWPAVARLIAEIGPSRLDAVREAHTTSGAHKLVTVPFAEWLPDEVRRAAEKMSAAEAHSQLGGALALRTSRRPATSPQAKRRRR
jgi:hypothetical protein